MRTVLSISPNNPFSSNSSHIDIRILAAHGVIGYSAFTSLPIPLPDGSVYNQALDYLSIKSQIESALYDPHLITWKISELVSQSFVRNLAGLIQASKAKSIVCYPDIPSVISKSDQDNLIDAFVLELMPLCSLLVLNLSTARLIIDDVRSLELKPTDIASELVNLGAKNVLIVGLPNMSNLDSASCILASCDQIIELPYLSLSYPSGKVNDVNILCTAITANLAKGKNLVHSVEDGIVYTRQVFITSTKQKNSQNIPLNHFLNVVITELLEKDTINLEDQKGKIDSIARNININKLDGI